MCELTVLGELLIDFTPEGRTPSGVPLFSQNPGGAVANVACTATRCGHTAAFCGKVGTDFHGAYLRETLASFGVNTRALYQDPEVPTTLAFVQLSAKGERDFVFYRNPGADTRLQPDEIPTDLIRNTRILHVGSLSMTHEPSASATRAALAIARSASVVISFDPNDREKLWSKREQAVRAMLEIYSYADLVKLSEEEAKLLFGIKDPYAEAPSLFADRARIVVITTGADGAAVHTPGHVRKVPGESRVAVVDTTGAGDIFWGAFLSAFLDAGRSPASLTVDDVREFARFGNAVAALSVGTRGAIPSIPSAAMIQVLRKK